MCLLRLGKMNFSYTPWLQFLLGRCLVVMRATSLSLAKHGVILKLAYCDEVLMHELKYQGFTSAKQSSLLNCSIFTGMCKKKACTCILSSSGVNIVHFFFAQNIILQPKPPVSMLLWVHPFNLDLQTSPNWCTVPDIN